jgi:hypothetical protein
MDIDGVDVDHFEVLGLAAEDCSGDAEETLRCVGQLDLNIALPIPRDVDQITVIIDDRICN